MKPLQRIITTKKIYNELTNRGFSWNDFYQYLKCYNSDIRHYEHDSWDSLEEYFSAYVSDLTDDVIKLFKMILSIKLLLMPTAGVVDISGYL